MNHLFYIYVFLTNLLLIALLIRFSKLKKIQEWYDKYEKVTGKIPKIEDFRTGNEYLLLTSLSIVNFLEILAILGGFFTKSWYIYLMILILSMLINSIVKSFRFTLFGKIISFSNQILRILIYSILIINHFYFHKDFYSELSYLF